jgi:hypothetical protein
MNLFNVAAEYRAAAEKLEDLCLDDQTFSDTLESIGGDLEAKAMNTAFVARNMEATAEQIKVEIERMAERAKALENRAKRIRKYLMDGLTLAGRDKIETPFFKIKIALNPPSVAIDDESMIPAAYKTEPLPPAPAPDRKLIAAALKDGFDVPGCRLVRGTRLDIR